MTLTLHVRRAFHSPGYIVVDDPAKPTRLFGYFSDRETAEEHAPKLAKADAALVAAQALRHPPEDPSTGQRLIKRKAG